MAQPNTKQRPLLTIGSTAEILAVSERTVHRLIKEKHLQVCRIGGAVRVLPDAVDRYIAAHSK